MEELICSYKIKEIVDMDEMDVKIMKIVGKKSSNSGFVLSRKERDIVFQIDGKDRELFRKKILDEFEGKVKIK